ncbi:hypothetical protein [Catenulispora subtropica]|uniref:Uncharacterized protein n=1 Tax=Catenulispora subtropica TaxID=450798 RepID=A0ABN2R1L0_9ACTN
MSIDIRVKVASFCRELEDGTLEQLVRAAGQIAVYEQARTSLETGTIDEALESDLDALNAAVEDSTGRGFYPSGLRIYTPLPGAADGHGARVWGCPWEACTGRGRVKAGQNTPICAATGKPLTPKAIVE